MSYTVCAKVWSSKRPVDGIYSFTLIVARHVAFALRFSFSNFLSCDEWSHRNTGVTWAFRRDGNAETDLRLAAPCFVIFGR